MSKHGDKTLRTIVLMIITPRKYVQPMTQFMDYLLLHSKTVPGYIPPAVAYKHENADAFQHNILAQHHHGQWMDDRRNIQVQFDNDTYRATAQLGKDGKVLLEFLKLRDDVIAVRADYNNKRFNISVDQKHFRDVQQKIHDDIQAQTFRLQSQ